MNRAFTLLELIVVIVIVSIISSIGIYKMFYTLDSASLLEAKTQIAQIRNKIMKKYNDDILISREFALDYLDSATTNSAGEMLFSKILDYPAISTTTEKQEVASWIKTSQNSYVIVLSKNKSVEFIYDKSTATFDCDFNNELCQELY